MTIIFDFDQTIADTSALMPYRKARDWSGARRNVSRIQPYDQILNVYSALSGKYKIGIVTTSPKTYCECCLSHLRIKVDHIVGYHDVSNRKPHPESILLAIKRLDSNPKNTIGFGDLANDILAYNAAGITSVACLWGAEDATSLKQAKPTYTISKPIEILQVLEKNFSPYVS